MNRCTDAYTHDLTQSCGIELRPAYGWQLSGAAWCRCSASQSQLEFTRQVLRAPERPALGGPSVRAPLAHFLHVRNADTASRRSRAARGRSDERNGWRHTRSHTRALRYVAHAAARDDATAAAVEKRKEREYKAEVDAGCYEFWLAAIETLRCLDEKFMKLLRKLCDPAVAASKGVVTRSACMQYTLRCISMQLQANNHVLEQAMAGFFARAAGQSFEMGLARPRAEE